MEANWVKWNEVKVKWPMLTHQQVSKQIKLNYLCCWVDWNLSEIHSSFAWYWTSFNSFTFITLRELHSAGHWFFLFLGVNNWWSPPLSFIAGHEPFIWHTLFPCVVDRCLWRSLHQNVVASNPAFIQISVHAKVPLSKTDYPRVVTNTQFLNTANHFGLQWSFS